MWANRSKEDMVESLEQLGNGSDLVPMDGINSILAHSPASELNREALEDGGPAHKPASVVWRAFPYANTVTDRVDEMDFDRETRTALKAAVLNESRNEPEEVKIGTVHAAKGLEAPGVLLFNSYNKHLRDAYYSDEDTRKEEHRLAYVGATRAKRRLYVVNNYFDGPRMEPLEKAHGVGVKA